MATSSISAAYPSAREALLVSTTSTAAHPSQLLLLDAQLPSATHPLLAFKLQQPHSIGSNKLDHAPTVNSATDADAAPDGAGYVVTQADGSAVLTLHSFQSPQLLSRIILPFAKTAGSSAASAGSTNGAVSCLCINVRFSLLSIGLHDGRIALWDLKTGQLVHQGAGAGGAFDAHYRRVTILRWTADGTALISGGDDGRIAIWPLATLVDPTQADHHHGHATAPGVEDSSIYRFTAHSSGSNSNDQPIPYAVFSDHTLSVTGLELSPSPNCSSSSGPSFPSNTTLWSASLDGTVKHWSLRTRTLLSTFRFPRPVRHVALDAALRFLLVVTTPAATAADPDPEAETQHESLGSNTLFKVDLQRKVQARAPGGTKRSAAVYTTFEPRGAHASSEAETIAAPDLGDASAASTVGSDGVARLAFPTAGGESISCISLSPSSSMVTLGTSHGRLFLVNPATLQMVRTLSLVASLSSNTSASVSAKGGVPSISNVQMLLTPADLMSSHVSSGAAGSSSAPSSALSPLHQSLLATHRAAGRSVAHIPPPLLTAQLERTSRRSAALIQNAGGDPSASGAAGGAAEESIQQAPRLLSRVSASNGTGHHINGRISRRQQQQDEQQEDELVSFLAPGFFDGLLPLLPPRSKPASSTFAGAAPSLKRTLASANGEDSTISDDMILLDSKSTTFPWASAVSGSGNNMGQSEEEKLRTANEELKRMLERAKVLNDELWTQVQTQQAKT